MVVVGVLGAAGALVSEPVVAGQAWEQVWGLAAVARAWELVG